jgi:hypothetical protein
MPWKVMAKLEQQLGPSGEKYRESFQYLQGKIGVQRESNRGTEQVVSDLLCFLISELISRSNNLSLMYEEKA